MITIIKENGIQLLNADEWPDYKKMNTAIFPDDIFCILVNISVSPYSLTISSPNHSGPGILNNRVLITPEAVNLAFQFHQSFDPLRQELMNSPVSGFKPNEIALLAYFYLNPLPFSVSLITRWFIDAGLEVIRAQELADAVFTARTNRESAELWFINDEILSYSEPGDLLPDLQHHHTPDNFGDVLNLFQKSTDVSFSYDPLDLLLPDKTDSTLHINMGRIQECSFLVEDHSFVIAGLATTVTEMAALSEIRWPVFHSMMIDSIPLYLRDFYSTGRLVSEKPDVLLSLLQEHSCEIDLISIDRNGKVLNTTLKSWYTKSGSQEGRVEIPVYLRIRKP
ncbi:MAG: hypothetical protein FD166_1141 [Bacteroidetes bacterium]|nr:MAG: hypothetical protein FD166_1141 [Bacteroidota bacterium]